MEYVNEVWRTDLYRLQKQAPKAYPIACQNTSLINTPVQYGSEYHGNICRDEAELLLKNAMSGSYLIRDGMRSPGTYTLVIKFDDTLKNYKLYYDGSSKQHYVGFKYFDQIIDLVQDGLIHLYIESRGAMELKKIAESNIYEESPFYKARYYTLQINQNETKSKGSASNTKSGHDNKNYVYSQKLSAYASSKSQDHHQHHHKHHKRKQANHNQNYSLGNVEEEHNQILSNRNRERPNQSMNQSKSNNNVIVDKRLVDNVDSRQVQSSKNPFLDADEILTEDGDVVQRASQESRGCGPLSVSASASNNNNKMYQHHHQLHKSSGALEPICPPIRHSSLLSSQLSRLALSSCASSSSCVSISHDKDIPLQNYRTGNQLGEEDDHLVTALLDENSRSLPSNTTTIRDPTTTAITTTNNIVPIPFDINNNSSCSLEKVFAPSTTTQRPSIDSSIDSPAKYSLLQHPLPHANNNVNLLEQQKPHNFKTHTFRGPHWCDFCTHFMWGLVAQGVKCQDCGFQAHRKCSDRVPHDCLPDMKRLKRIFGVELTSLCKAENRSVPILLLRLIQIVESRGLCTEGIYRVSGNTEIIELVKAEVDKDLDSVDLESDERLIEIHNITSLVKLFFRQLPIPLITIEVSSQLIEIIKTGKQSETGRIERFREALLKLPFVHYSTLQYLLLHLTRVTSKSSVNKMTVENLAIIFAPSLVSHNPIQLNSSNNHNSSIITPYDMHQLIHQTLQTSVDFVEFLIRYTEYLFNTQPEI